MYLFIYSPLKYCYSELMDVVFFHWCGNVTLYNSRCQRYLLIYLYVLILMYLLVYFSSIIPLFFHKILFQINGVIYVNVSFSEKVHKYRLTVKKVFFSILCVSPHSGGSIRTQTQQLHASSEQCYIKQSEGSANFLQDNTTLLFRREVRQRIGQRGTVRPRDWAIQSTPASSYCLGRSTFEYSLSLRPSRWERLRRRTAFSPLLFYLQLNAFQMEQLYRKQFR